MTQAMTTIRTEDGVCPAHVFRPEGAGPWPGVLFYIDGLGMRPAMAEMGERLAAAGYYVLMPDLFWRAGAYAPVDANKFFADPAVRDDWIKRVMSTASAANVMRDSRAFLAHLAAQPDVKQPKVGTTGYCMGGRMSLTAAGTFPERIAAAASYHGGRLATDAEDSPHLLAPMIRARVYIAGAIEDASFDDAQKQRLADALTAAKVDHKIETYPARHGWVTTDAPVHDAAQAERHWQTLLRLFGETLR